MKQEFEFITAIHDNKIQCNVSELISDCFKKFNGSRVVITIKKLRGKRSDRQNRFYHRYYIQSQIDCFQERWGEIYTKEQVHTWNLNNIWCEEKVDQETGEIFKIPGSSKTKNKMEFEERLEMGRQFFYNKFGWQLPYPNQEPEINFKQ